MIYTANDHIRKAVIDTEPLLSLLILTFTQAISLERRNSVLNKSRISSYLKTDLHKQELFIHLFDSIPDILTTSHVIAEIKGHQSLKGDYEQEFWIHSMNYFRIRKFDERSPIKIIDMIEKEVLKESVCRIGPVDTALIELTHQEGCTLLTEDRRTLANFAWQQGLDCKIVEDILS